jgi:drug/metabolite transporter (DMT)-like permease
MSHRVRRSLSKRRRMRDCSESGMKISKSIQADLALITITFVWGSTFTIVKQSLALVSPILFVAMRFWIATALTLAFMPGQMQKVSVKSLGRGLVLSGVLSGGFIFQTLGLRSTSPSNSAFITSLSVLLVPLLGFLLFRQRPTLQTILGVILATSGLFLLLVNLGDLKIQSGDVLTLICAILFGLQILLLSRFVTKTDYRQLQLLQMVGAAVFCTILVPVLESPFVFWDSNLVLYLLITGVLATAIAFYVQARAQRLTTPNRVALIFSLEPFFAALFAYWILDQMLTAREWLGGILVLTGILVSELQLARRGMEDKGP